MNDLQPPTPTIDPNAPATADPSRRHPTTDTAVRDHADPLSPSDDYWYVDSTCSTPFVSASSSPGRPIAGGGGYFYSAPASPQFVFSTSFLRSSRFVPSPPEASDAGTSGSGSFEFEFSARFATSENDSTVAAEIGLMSSADELFLNGKIRPMKLSTHLQRSQVLAPLTDVAESEDNVGSSNEMRGGREKNFYRDGRDGFQRSRDLRLRDRSLRRRTRSLSPLRNTASFDWCELVVKGDEEEEHGIGKREKILKDRNRTDGDGHSKAAGDETVSYETTPSASASSSRCSSAGRSSKRWVFLKDFLRSKSEGRNNHKFWTSISFSPAKEKRNSISQQSQPPKDSKEKMNAGDPLPETQKSAKKAGKEAMKKSVGAGKPVNGVGKRRIPLSAHELHYTANRAQAEEMRKKTFLPYKQGLLGCLGFSSKSYGAMNGVARALNPVSSR